MTQTTANLKRKIGSAGDLHAVVRTMKAMAAANIAQYEQAVQALDDYYRSVELGLSVCFKQDQAQASIAHAAAKPEAKLFDAVVFGSDQGLVGRFNDEVADFAMKALAAKPGRHRIWAVGERVHARLMDAGMPVIGLFGVPHSVRTITPLVGLILTEIDKRHKQGHIDDLHLFYNQPTAGAAYAPAGFRLLPLDENWRLKLTELRWPTRNLPEVMGNAPGTLRALIREYLFISLFRACAESLASENASRLAAMQRADKNIDELLESLNGDFHRQRQSAIDEELFDVVSGFEALKTDAV